jgi:hypothetical protein
MPSDIKVSSPLQSPPISSLSSLLSRPQPDMGLGFHRPGRRRRSPPASPPIAAADVQALIPRSVPGLLSSRRPRIDRCRKEELAGGGAGGGAGGAWAAARAARGRLAGSSQAAARAARGRRRAAGAGGVQLGSCVGEKMGKK